VPSPTSLFADLEVARDLPRDFCSLPEAERYTRRLATSHYENFNVVSWLLPQRLHQHFYNLYAYCRWADDLGDEVADSARALRLLDWWEAELRHCYAGKPAHPVFVALAKTIRAFDIPITPFSDLLIAFRQDQIVHRYATWDEMIGYCRYSANPVGRLVLYLCGYRDVWRQGLSDATCTALQLANFWQDVSRDLEKGRIYIPLDALRKHGLEFANIEAGRFASDDVAQRYTQLMRDLIARTRALFAEGYPLAASISRDLRVDIEMFSRGGMAVLDAIEAIGYNTLEHRPSIGKGKQARLLVRALIGRAMSLLHDSVEPESSDSGAAAASSHSESDSSGAAAQPVLGVASSYDECRNIARNAASNFYYAFYLLPEEKRRALCALYAYMRLVDDAADQPGDVAAKQRSLARWRALTDAAYAGEVSAHTILPAFADTCSRFSIPARYFHDLISGAEMDLTVPAYPTFDRLREYCYRVAGTVGLTCIHVFGFRDPRAPDVAERLGIAFQLTNILRDLKADYEMGRIYLPQEDLEQFGVRDAELAGPLTPRLLELLEFQADRAWGFYEEGAEIVGLVEQDSRGALWALARTYSALLSRIESRGFEVFDGRVRLGTAEKFGILVRAQLGAWSEAHVLEKRGRDRRRTGGVVRSRRAG